MIGLLKYLKNYKKESMLAPLFKMLEAVFDLLVPLVVARMIDMGIAKNNTTYVLQMGGVLILLAFVGLTLSITAQYFAAKAAAGFGTQLRHALFCHIQGLSYTALDQQGTSTLITRMTSDVNQVQAQVNMAIRLLLRSPFIVFGATVMAFFVDAKVALVFVIAIPVLSLIVYGITLVTIPLYRKVQKRLDRVMESTRENLSGVRVIRAFRQEMQEVTRYREENALLNQIQIFAGKISTIMNPATYILINLATIGILWVGGTQVNAGVLTQGKVVALVNYMAQILVELVKLASLIINLTKSFACAARIQEVFAIPTGMGEGTAEQSDARVAVELTDVSLTYAGAKEPSLEGVNFKVLKGQTVGIIGSTGSAKTSLVNLLPRFYDATTGQVKIFGTDVREYPVAALRKLFGIVPQKAMLFQGTIRSNLLWGNEDASEEELMDALKMSQSYEFVMKKDEGLDADVAQNGKNFSGGQKQRLTIARALVRKPEILILDDSSSALDYLTDAKLRKAIRGLTDTTIFVVSQRTSSIRHADQIVVLDDGQVVGVGKHEMLLKSCPVYQEIHAAQFQAKNQSGTASVKSEAHHGVLTSTEQKTVREGV